MNLFQNNIHGWLVFPSCVILVSTIERPFAHIKKLHWTTPFMQKFSFGHEPFSKQCPWFTSFPFACDIGAYNWMTFCTHKKVTMGSPFMQKILLCRKFIYVENSFMHKILLCRKSIYAENSFMQINSFMQKNSFYAEKSLYAEKFLYAEKISFRHKPFTKQCP